MVFRRSAAIKPVVADSNKGEPISVIVVAKNEKQNLQALVPVILEQDYNEFELIIVDDQSWDGTHEWLHELLPLHNNLKLVSLGENLHSSPGKKLGLTLGIKKAKYDALVFTDADCLPNSKHWLANMAQAYDTETDVVLGYSPYKSKNTLFNPFIRFEGFWVAWQYSSFALAGLPYMGVGRNMGYRKSRFLENKGFANSLKVPFGDDDLLVQEIANGKNTKVVLSKDSHVITEPKPGPKSWTKQKRRHLSAGRHYKPKFKFVLGLVWLSRAAYLLAAILFLIFGTLSYTTLALAVLPMLIDWIFAFAMNYKYKMLSIWYAYPILELIYQLVLYPIFGLITTFHPQKNGW
ncbi:MAG: glycosyltransferase [Bacteroidia bacterium]